MTNIDKQIHNYLTFHSSPTLNDQIFKDNENGVKDEENYQISEEGVRSDVIRSDQMMADDVGCKGQKNLMEDHDSDRGDQANHSSRTNDSKNEPTVASPYIAIKKDGGVKRKKMDQIQVPLTPKEMVGGMKEENSLGKGKRRKKQPLALNPQEFQLETSTEKKPRVAKKKYCEVGEMTKNFFSYDWQEQLYSKYNLGNVPLLAFRVKLYARSLLALYKFSILLCVKRSADFSRPDRGKVRVSPFRYPSSLRNSRN